MRYYADGDLKMSAKKETEEEKQNRIIEQETRDFFAHLLPYGSLNVRAAIEFCLEAGLSGDDLGDIVTDFCEGTDTKLSDADVVYLVKDHVLQMARNAIHKIAGYDFCNDYRGDGQEIYTYANYLDSQYDYSEEAKGELSAKLHARSDGQKEVLKEDKMVVCFLNEIGITV